MDSIFKLCKKGTCGITITGLEKDNDEYLNEDSEIVVSTRDYAYSQTITLNVLTSIKSSGEETLQKYDIVEHNIDCIDESDMEMPIDGLYEVSHIIIPTNEWLDYVIERDENALLQYSTICYFDKDSQQFMVYKDEQSSPISIEEVLEINPAPPVEVIDKTTTIIRGDKNTFCICHLNECFYKICKGLLGDIQGKCLNKLDHLSLSIYNRDIVWMALNIIKYLIELGQYYEAQRILENVTQCGNICREVFTSTNVIGENNCGCSY